MRVLLDVFNMICFAEDSLSSLGGKDVDHRNLISLTGSPGTETNTQSNDTWNNSMNKVRLS